MSFILEYISFCMVFFFIFFTFILCFKIANYFACEWFDILKLFASKLISTIKRKENKQ